jgi:hypothetical protein
MIISFIKPFCRHENEKCSKTDKIRGNGTRPESFKELHCRQFWAR